MRLCLSILAFGLIAAVLAGCGGGGAPPTEQVRVGNVAPDFSLKSLDGEKMTMASFAGQPVVLSFWATWCQPCYAEIPVLKDLEQDSSVRVVTIALDEKGEGTVRPFVDKEEIDYLVLLGNEDTFSRFNGFSIPYSLVLDRDHRIVNIYRGPITEESIASDLESLAAARAPEAS